MASTPLALHSHLNVLAGDNKHSAGGLRFAP
jgi:hypothetical protein